MSGKLVTFSSYYNGGGKFTLYEGTDANKNVEILARYKSLPDTPVAIVKSVVGNKGVAILTGIHPEYDTDVLTRDDKFVKAFIDELDKWHKERVNCFADLLRHLRINLKF